MSTPNTRDAAPTLDQIHAHLLEIDPTLRSQSKRPVTLPAEYATLQQLNTDLKRINATFMSQARALYQDVIPPDLNSRLKALDETSAVAGQSRKTYLTFTAGINALELETRLNVSDNLLSPADQRMLENCSLGPTFRPGMYALAFTYQEQTVTFAGAFVLTRQANPVVDSLQAAPPVGPVLLFTPARGLEAFDSLHDLDQGLQSAMALATGRAEFNRHLPVRYQHLDTVDIWPLTLLPIQDKPLFEHVYQALLDKREQDINYALSHADATHIKEHLDNAIQAALPDLTLRLDFRAQRLLERDLFYALPDWYRSASKPLRDTLDQHLRNYNQAREAFMNLFGPAATPQALARHQWAEKLADELDIHDLDPDLLRITTRRTVPPVGTYEQQRSLVELALRGLHTGDSAPGSAFLEHSTLSYAGAPLDMAYARLTPQVLIPLLQDLQPRLDFADTQKTVLGTPQIKQAARTFFDQRLVALAYIAQLQGHLSPDDVQLFADLRENPRPQLCAQTVLLHGAQLRDLWLLREDDAHGQVKRLLLCTPDAPSAQQFFAFSSLRECQTHIIGWLDQPHTMSNYVLQQVPLRFRPKMSTFIQAISLRPDAEEHREVTFGKPCSHADCLDAMAAHRLALQLDDYSFSSPAWFRNAPLADRTRLITLADNIEGALRTYNARPDAEANFPSFDSYLRDKARLSLNRLLGRSKNDVDPDSVFAYSPRTLLGAPPTPLSYTTLYRDGYADGIGFLDEKFSRSAVFRGPRGVDLSPLTAQNVARSVTGVWVGEHYINEVRQRLQSSDSPGYHERRSAVLAIHQLQMQSAALEARLKGHITSVDLSWLNQAIDSLSDTRSTTRNTYKVHRLFIDGDWVLGNYLFSHADYPVLLYTPNAPDGVNFREAKLFNYLLKKVEGMPGYWCSRVSLPSMRRVHLFLENARNGLPDDIDRTTPSPARHDSISRVTPLLDLRHELYNMSLQRTIDDVHGTTINRTQMITGILWTCIEWVTAIATMPFPLLSLTLGGLLAFKDAMLALNAYHQNDRAAAIEHYVGFLANAMGAVLFDLRPLLKSSFKPLRAVIQTSSHAVGSAPLKQLDAINPEGMQSILFDGQPLWVSQTPDALGRYLLYRHDPLTGQLHSTARLVSQNSDGQWVRFSVPGGGRKQYEKLLADESSPLEAFDVAPDQAKTFRTLLDSGFQTHMQSRGQDAAAAQGNAFIEAQPLRTAYEQNVARLSEDADAFYQALPAPAPKSALPALASNAAHSDILKSLFSRNKRLIIGAVDNSIASKQLLIEQLPGLAEQGLKRVYIENLPRDLFHRKLKVLNNQLNGNKAHALQQIERHLAQVDEALGFAADAPFTYRKLLLETQRLNIAIDGLDAAVSYHMGHVLALGEGARFVPRSSKLRNFYSHTAIELNLKHNPDEGWLALVETNRLGSYERIAGLAELQQAPALRVHDVAPGEPTGLWPDTHSSAQSRGDYALSIATTHGALRAPSSLTPASGTVSHYAAFDIPAPMRANIDQMRLERRGLDSRYSHAQPENARAMNTFIETRQRLYATAKAHFADLTLPQRRALGELTSARDESVLFERLFKQRNGLVIGEAHTAQSSKRLLIQYFKHLKKLGVKTLYLEHLLTDLHQEALETYYRTSKMPSILENYLRQLDRGQMPLYEGTDTYTHLVKKANKYGIRIRALDCTATYYIKGLNGDLPRLQMFSYFANEVIKADQLAQGPHKWVAFVGSTHTDTHLGVPGLATLQDAVSLHVRDSAPELARPLHQGAWESFEEGKGVALRSDFTLYVGIPGRKVPSVPAPPDRSRLTTPGHFIVERRTSTEINLVHMSRGNEIVTTPIQINDKGQFLIERWPEQRHQRFFYLSQLVDMLKTPPPRGVGLNHVG